MSEFTNTEIASFIAQQTDSRVFIYKDFHLASSVSSTSVATLGNSIQTAVRNSAVVESFGCSMQWDEDAFLPLELHKNITCNPNMLSLRKSCRDFSDEPMSKSDLEYLFSFIFGSFPDKSHRVYSSAGACYPNEFVLNIRNVEGIEAGLYVLSTNRFGLVKIGQLLPEMTMDTHERDAALTIAIFSLFARVAYKYGERGYRFALLEAGAIAQMIELASASIGLGAVSSGSYLDSELLTALRLSVQQAGVLTAIHLGRRK